MASGSGRTARNAISHELAVATQQPSPLHRTCWGRLGQEIFRNAALCEWATTGLHQRPRPVPRHPTSGSTWQQLVRFSLEADEPAASLDPLRSFRHGAKAVSVAVQRVVRRLRNSVPDHSTRGDIAWPARYLAEAWYGARNRLGMFRTLAATCICAVVPGASGRIKLVVVRQGSEWKIVHCHRSAMPK
jgi:hypothetical protein